MTQIAPTKTFDHYAEVLTQLAAKLIAAPDAQLAPFAALNPAHLQSVVADYRQSNLEHAEAHLATKNEASQTDAVYHQASLKFGEWQYTVRARYFGQPEMASLFTLPKTQNHAGLMAKLEHFLLVFRGRAVDFGEFLNISTDKLEQIIQSLKAAASASAATVQKLDQEETERQQAKQALKSLYSAAQHLIHAAYPSGTNDAVRDEYLKLFESVVSAKVENVMPSTPAAV